MTTNHKHLEKPPQKAKSWLQQPGEVGSPAALGLLVFCAFVTAVSYKQNTNRDKALDEEFGPFNNFSLTHELDGIETTLVSPSVITEQQGTLKTYYDLANDNIFYSDIRVFSVDRGDVIFGPDITKYKSGKEGVTDLTAEAKERMISKVCEGIVATIPTEQPVRSSSRHYQEVKAVSDGFANTFCPATQ